MEIFLFYSSAIMWCSFVDLLLLVTVWTFEVMDVVRRSTESSESLRFTIKVHERCIPLNFTLACRQLFNSILFYYTRSSTVQWQANRRSCVTVTKRHDSRFYWNLIFFRRWKLYYTLYGRDIAKGETIERQFLWHGNQ